MKATFVLPGHATVPIGGYAIVYEYANGLAARGHQVTLVHPLPRQRPSGLRAAASGRKWVYMNRRLGRRAIDWFALESGVRVSFVPSLDERFIPRGDAVVATAWWTAPIVAGYGDDRGAGMYLLQQHETWEASSEEIDDTFRLPIHKIATGRWLADVAAGLGEEARTTYIPNGIDTRRFRTITPIDARPPRRLAMLYHPGEWKGVPDGLEAVSRARAVVPELEAVLFGTDPRPDSLPSWITYIRNPHGEELVQLYNSCAIFLHPSWSEGCPLPPAEAMACGCALVAAANSGVLDYAVDRQNALLAPIREPVLLADALVQMLSSDRLRQDIASRGQLDMQGRDWATCIDRFERVVADLRPQSGEPDR